MIDDEAPSVCGVSLSVVVLRFIGTAARRSGHALAGRGYMV